MFPSPKKLDRVFSEESFLLWENPQINIMETIMNDKEHATMLFDCVAASKNQCVKPAFIDYVNIGFTRP